MDEIDPMKSEKYAHSVAITFLNHIKHLLKNWYGSKAQYPGVWPKISAHGSSSPPFDPWYIMVMTHRPRPGSRELSHEKPWTNTP
jgi:hypothetical protein